MTNEGYKRLRAIEEKLEALEIAIGVHQTEMNTVVGDIEVIAAGLVEKAVKKMVEQMIDEKIADVKKLEYKFGTKLATVNSRVASLSEKLANAPALAPAPTPIPVKEDTKVLDPLTKVQKKRIDRLMEYMRYHGRSITRREAVIGVWHDVPKSQISKCLKLGLDHGLIELDEEAMEDYFKKSGGKTPDHGGPNRKLRFYRLKPKEKYTGPGSLKGINKPPFPYHPHQNMNPDHLKGEYYGDN